VEPVEPLNSRTVGSRTKNNYPFEEPALNKLIAHLTIPQINTKITVTIIINQGI
jgi:hypothetical protein